MQVRFPLCLANPWYRLFLNSSFVPGTCHSSNVMSNSIATCVLYSSPPGLAAKCDVDSKAVRLHLFVFRIHLREHVCSSLVAFLHRTCGHFSSRAHLTWLAPTPKKSSSCSSHNKNVCAVPDAAQHVQAPLDEACSPGTCQNPQPASPRALRPLLALLLDQLLAVKGIAHGHLHKPFMAWVCAMPPYLFCATT
jgi:hypothetical protein